MRKVLLSSDHFDKDHYDYYDPYISNYRLGSDRGRSIGELADYFNQWRG